MMICTIYSYRTGFDEVLDTAKDIYPKGLIVLQNDQESQIATIEIPGGFFQSNKKIRISYRQRVALSGANDCPLTKNISGLYGYVSSLPAKNEMVRNLFLAKIRTLKAEFSIMQEQGETKELKLLIQTLAKRFDAVLFVQPHTVISQSAGQHFLDKNLDLIIDQSGNCAIDTLEVKIDAAGLDSEPYQLTAEQTERKRKSEMILNGRGVKINANLPCIESKDQIKVRTPKEVAERIVALAVINLVAFDSITNDEAVNYFKKYALWGITTPKERAFLANPTPQAKNQETWKCEAIWVLMWAIKKVDNLGFPDTLCDLTDIPPSEYPVGDDKDPNEFIGRITDSRSAADILDVNDLYYRFDWACVDGRINHAAVANLNPGVVYERHYALNWLIGYMDEEWDDITCDT